MTIDDVHMLRAVRLGERALGTTAENPPVGCVIAKGDKVLGLGWTQPSGRPHAETEALAMAGEAARGATAYVTLEPCAHRGRTPPCAEALVKAGISRVMAAIEDPDPRTAGKGLAILRQAGIKVVAGIGADAARPALVGFLTRIAKNRPYVLLKLAVSADGKIAAKAGERTRITGEQAGVFAHMLRARSDAILVGLRTVGTDDPELVCRLPGLAARSPIRVVADSRLAIPRSSRLVQTAAEVPTWLLTTVEGDIPGLATIICAATAIGEVDLKDAMAKLAARGINRLMVEGGARLARAFLEADLVDEVVLLQSKTTIGEGGVDALEGLPLSIIDDKFKRVTREMLGSDALSVYGRK